MNRRQLHHVSPDVELFTVRCNPKSCLLCTTDHIWVGNTFIIILFFLLPVIAAVASHVGTNLPLVGGYFPPAGKLTWMLVTTLLVYTFLDPHWLPNCLSYLWDSQVIRDPREKVVEEIKEHVRKERAKALATELERRPENRAAYIRAHRKELEENEKAIREEHERIFSNSVRVEFFRKYGGEEVIEMWREPYLRVMYLHGVFEQRVEQKSEGQKRAERFEKAAEEEFTAGKGERQTRAKLKERAIADGMSPEEAEVFINDIISGIRFRGPRL